MLRQIADISNFLNMIIDQVFEYAVRFDLNTVLNDETPAVGGGFIH